MGERVTEEAVVARLQRFLATKGKYLRIAGSERQKWGLGRYYVLGAKGVIDKDVDIEKLARKLGLLDPLEKLEK